MAIDNDALLLASRGTVFWASAETPLPAGGVNDFTLNKDFGDDGPWKNLGHTSNENLLGFSADGGDATKLATWLDPDARTTYEDVTLTVTGASVQADAESLKLIYNAWEDTDGGLVSTNQKREQKLALFVLAYDSSKNVRFGVYMPNTSFSYDSGNLLAFSNDGFTEFGFTATTQTSTTLKTGPNGEAGTFKMYPPNLFVAPKA